jgi:hypothetical protein
MQADESVVYVGVAQGQRINLRLWRPAVFLAKTCRRVHIAARRGDCRVLLSQYDERIGQTLLKIDNDSHVTRAAQETEFIATSDGRAR